MNFKSVVPLTYLLLGENIMSTTTETSYFEERGFTLAWEKVFIVHDAKGCRVETKLFFSLPFDLLLKPIVDTLNSFYVWEPGMKGPGPYPPVAMFKAILYAKLNKNMSDRALERHLSRNPGIASALGFEKVPSHKTISYFKRERLKVDLLEEVFSSLRDHLVAAGMIDYSSVTIDSAPIKAFVTLAKANKEVKLNDALACSLYDDEKYKILAKALVESLPFKNSSLAQVQKRIVRLSLIVLYELGGFLSRAKVFKYLEKKKHSALFKAVLQDCALPSDATLSTFNKRLQTVVGSAQFHAFRSHIDKFFANISDSPDCSLKMLFPGQFAVLQASCSIVDPDARLGYCAAKKLPFLGYRVQLIIDDKKKLRLK